MKVLEKLKKVPGFVQTLLVGFAILYLDLVENVESLKTTLLSFAEMFREAGIDTSGMDLDMLATTFGWVFWVMQFIVGIIVFELISYLVYRSMYGKRQIDGQKGLIMTGVRFTFIALVLVVGSFKLFGFLNIYASEYIDAVLFSVAIPIAYTALFALFLRTGHIYCDRAGTAYQTLFWLWFGIAGVLEIIGLVQNATALVAGASVNYLIISVVRVAVMASTGAGLWFTVRKKFMEIQKDPPTDDGGGDGGSEIFRGYGL